MKHWSSPAKSRWIVLRNIALAPISSTDDRSWKNSFAAWQSISTSPSSTLDYARAIVALLFPPHIALKFVWGRNRCVQRYDGEWQANYYVKDLRKVKRLGYDLRRVLIVDDTPQKCERNYGNAVYVPEYLGDESDVVLMRLASYLATLASTGDVRKVEKRNWKSRF